MPCRLCVLINIARAESAQQKEVLAEKGMLGGGTGLQLDVCACPTLGHSRCFGGIFARGGGGREAGSKLDPSFPQNSRQGANEGGGIFFSGKGGGPGPAPWFRP